ncbi:HAD family hydrolase [Gulosibacter bifidus]|uniref:HAD family hydrolase n=1 Tax=Gulosibacter bifidus TaxID=272239 RepID=A0ABW5RG79_9MICO|nr:HAD family phosphatase [Gulosibacter bifidus]
MTSYGPKAVLWDMDGTIVDTEPHWIRSQHEFLTRRGLPPLSAAQEMRLVGASPTITAEVFHEQGAVGNAAEFAAEVTAEVVVSVRRSVDARPGALELLRDMHAAGIPLALVTNSSRTLVDAVVEGLGIEDVFATCVAAEDVTEGKPDPEPFVTAASRLGISAAQCLVIEDSRNGLRGALAAGCTALAVPHGVAIDPHPDYLRLDSLRGVTWQDLCELFVAFHQRGEHHADDSA